MPAHFELSFGLKDPRSQDAKSTDAPAVLDIGLRLRGSIDLVERKANGSLRATDYKTGKVRAQKDAIIGGGEILQPVLYALTLEKLFPEAKVEEGVLYYCTAAGAFEKVSVALDDRARDAARTVAKTVGDALMRGFLPTAPGIGPPTGPWTGGPSLTHPNVVFRVDGVLHATRGTRGDAVATGDLGRPWAIAPVVVHDGIVTGDGVWFTRVDGHLVLVDPATGQIAQSVALQRPGDGPEPLGWCRGLCISDGIAWVGFSRLRATRLRRHLAWARGRLRGRPIATRRPTRVEGFDLSTGERVASVPLAGVEIDALFGIVALPGRTSG